MKLRSWSLVAAIGLLFASSLSAASTKLGARVQDYGNSRQILVKVRPSFDSATTLSRLSARVGRVFVRHPASHSYRLIVNDSLSTGAALSILRRDRAVVSVSPANGRNIPGLSDLASVRNLNRTIDRLEEGAESVRREEEVKRVRPNPRLPRSSKSVPVNSGARFGPEEEDGAGTDYLRAYRYWFSQRAFPNDKIPADAYRKAAAQRELLKPAPLRASKPKGGGISTLGIGAGWEFTGPRNLAPPYRVYWGPRPVSGRVNAVAFDPNNAGTYYVGAAGGGLWASYDSGVTWIPLGDAWPALQVSSIAVDPTDSNKIYVGTGDYDGFGVWSYGIQKSTDGGQTWTTVGGTDFGGAAVSNIIVDPESPNKVTVSTGRSNLWGASFVWHSEDYGQTWVKSIATASNWQRVVLGAKNLKGQRYMFAVSDTKELWRSTDRGGSWIKTASPVQNNGETNIGMSDHDFATIYLISAGDEKAYKSIDSGQTWTDVTGTLDDWNQSFYDMYIASAPGFDFWGMPEDIVYAGLVDFWRGNSELTDYLSAGQTTTSGALTHNDQHAFAIDPFDGTKSLLGNDGGAYLLQYNEQLGINNFTPLNNLLGITQFYKAAWHPTDPNIMLGGTQDNATPVSLGDLNNWENVAGGDGGYCAINSDFPNVQFATIYNATVIRTADTWLTQSDISPDIGSDHPPFVTCINLDPGDPNFLYLGTNYLWQWNDTKREWTPRMGNKALALGPTDVISCIAGFKGDHDRIYTGSTDGLVFMTTELRTFTRLNGPSSGLPLRSITSIDVDPGNKDDILVGLSGFGSGHLWRCLDTRAITPTFVDVSGTAPNQLPDAPINAIARDPFDPATTWYVGTDIGVFMTTDSGATWTNATGPLGLPNVQVNDIKAVPGTGFLNVATYGRGMWRIGLLTDKIFVDGLTLAPTSVCDGGSSIATVKIRYPAPPGGAVVDISTSNPAVTTVPATVTVPQGATTAQFPVLTSPVASTTQVTITASNAGTGTSASAVLTLTPFTVSGISITPNPCYVATTATGTIDLTCASANLGTVTLVSSDPTVATVPPSVTVNPGANSVAFLATPQDTGAGRSTTITATMNGNSVSVVLQVEGILDTLTLNPNPVLGGQPSTGTLRLKIPAPAGGIIANLSSSNTNVATVPATVKVLQGNTSATFTTTTKVIGADSNVTITATSHGTSRSAVLAVIANIKLTLTLNPTSVKGGFNSTGTVKLNVPAPPGGIIVNLASSIPQIAQTAATLTIPAGSTQRNFTITTSGVGIATDVVISATYKAETAQATLTVLPNAYPYSQKFKPNPACANSFTIGTVTLNGPAPAGGASVALSSSNTAVATVPASVTVLAGQLSANYTISTKDPLVNSSSVITATYAGVAKSDTLFVNASVLTSVAISPASIKGGGLVTLTINTSCPAPAGGAIISLATSDPSALEPPTTVIIPAGKTVANFQFYTKPVAGSTDVTITASYHGTNKSATTTVVP